MAIFGGMKPDNTPMPAPSALAFGIAALAFGLCYDVTQILDVLGVFRAPWGMLAIVLPSLFLAWSYVAFFAQMHARSDDQARPWTQVALVFAVIYATLNSFVYPVQLAVVIPQALTGGEGLAGPFAMVAGKPLTAVNAVAYALMSLAAFFLSFAYAHRAGGRFARVGLVAHGAMAPIILVILYVPALLPVGGLWLVTFPAAMIGVLKHTAGARRT
jgi:hypothetical protein